MEYYLQAISLPKLRACLLIKLIKCRLKNDKFIFLFLINNYKQE